MLAAISSKFVSPSFAIAKRMTEATVNYSICEMLGLGLRLGVRVSARVSKTRQDTTRHDTTRHDTTRHDTTRHGTTRHNTTRQDKTRQDTARQHDKARQGKARQYCKDGLTQRCISKMQEPVSPVCLFPSPLPSSGSVSMGILREMLNALVRSNDLRSGELVRPSTMSFFPASGGRFLTKIMSVCKT